MIFVSGEDSLATQDSQVEEDAGEAGYNCIPKNQP
jgi:hypothetical protein